LKISEVEEIKKIWRREKKSRREKKIWFALRHSRTASGGHGLPKESLSHAIPYLSTPCRRATSETTLWPFQGWPARGTVNLRHSSTLLDTPNHTPMALSARRNPWMNRNQISPSISLKISSSPFTPNPIEPDGRGAGRRGETRKANPRAYGVGRPRGTLGTFRVRH
jgi:hypothetical protein